MPKFSNSFESLEVSSASFVGSKHDSQMDSGGRLSTEENLSPVDESDIFMYQLSRVNLDIIFSGEAQFGE